MGWLTLTVVAGLAWAAAPSGEIDFDTDVLPVLTKAGCNAAACHGAAAGRGDFFLSLFGGDPAADYRAIVHDFEGRRVNFADPYASLVIRKPALELEHGGGQRFALDSAPAALLAEWIRQGAPRRQRRQFVQIAVEPAPVRVEKVPAQVSLRVTANFDDGSTRDATAEALYLPQDESSMAVGPAGEATVLRRGRHTVIVRYLSGLATVELTAPLAEVAPDSTPWPRTNWIDDEINATLAALGLSPAPPASDAAFLRRVRLDLTGRLPSPDEVRSFLADANPQKRERVIDELLQSADFLDYWTFKLATLFRVRAIAGDEAAMRAFQHWIRECLAHETSYDAMARDLLTAVGDSHAVGPANFHRVAPGPREQAEYVSEVFLAARLRCANCHNHPLDRWTQDDYHGLAAIFARIDRGREVRVLARGEVAHPGTGKAALPRIPGQRYLPEGTDGRQEFADWLTRPDNPHFARALANRLWKALLGRGLVEPTDDLRDTNPATHPQLLNRLAEDFAAHGYNLRHTLRLIAASAAYGRSAGDERRRDAHDARSVPLVDDRWYSRAMVRPLEPEVWLDAIGDVTGVGEQGGDQPLGARAIDLPNARASSETLDLLGRCLPQDGCEGASAPPGLTTQLHFLNGPLLNGKITATGGRLYAAIEQGRTNREIVAEFYMRALGRAPTAEESTFWDRELAATDPRQRRARLEDFAWSLLNSREFTTNH